MGLQQSEPDFAERGYGPAQPHRRVEFLKHAAPACGEPLFDAGPDSLAEIVSRQMVVVPGKRRHDLISPGFLSKEREIAIDSGQRERRRGQRCELRGQR